MIGANPYQKSAADYVAAGWDVFPLPYARKSPPPIGVTGSNGAAPSEEVMLLDWMEEGGNIGLRIPDGIVGIDIDGKEGMEQFKLLESRLGELDAIIVSTSHDDLAYGYTAFFRIPKGLKLKSGLGSKIDILQESHRYQVVAPSVHPSGRVYRWATMEGNTTPFIPELDDIDELPASWLDFIISIEGMKKAEELKDASFVLADLSGAECLQMKKVVNGNIFKLKKAKVSRHDSMVAAVWAIVSDASKGHGGGDEGLKRYAASWLSLFAEEEIGNRDLFGEFNAAVNSAQLKQVERRVSCSCRSFAGNDITGGIVTKQKMWR